MDSESRPISFHSWNEALAAASLPVELRATYRREILAFLHHCKILRAPASVMVVKQYLPTRERQGAKRRVARLAGVFRAAREQDQAEIISAGRRRPPEVTARAAHGAVPHLLGGPQRGQ